MPKQLLDILDRRRIQGLLDRVNEFSLLPAAIIDNRGAPITEPAPLEACPLFHAAKKRDDNLCSSSRHHLLWQFNATSPATSFVCPHGLSYSFMPLLIDDVQYGTILTGHCFSEPPDINFFAGLASKYGYEEDEYRETIKRIPVFPPQKLNSYLLFLKDFLTLLVESELQKISTTEAKEILAKTESRYHTILQTAMDGFVLTDLSGNILEANIAYCRMSGYSMAELLTMQIKDIEAIDDADFIEQRIQKIQLSGADQFVSLHRKKDGSVFTAEISTQFHPFENGRLVTFIKDITQTIKAQKDLQKSREQYKLLTDYSPDTIWSMNPELDFTYVSPSAVTLFGYQLEEWEHMNLWDVIHSDHRKKALKILKGLKNAKKQKYDKTELLIRHKSGKKIWVESTISSIWQEGILKGYAGVTRDISEKKLAEQELLAVNKKMRLAANSGKFGIWNLILRTNSLEWDDAMYFLYGISRDTFSGTYEAWRSGVHPDDQSQASEEVNRALRGEEEFDSEFRIIRPDGAIRHIRAAAVVSRDSNGEAVAMTGINFDITEEKQAKQNLKESEERFKALHNASFGGIAIHDRGIILECNRGLSEITGYAYEELIGMDSLRLIADDTRDMVVNNISAGYELPYEAKGQRKNGEIYHLRLEARNIPYKGQQVRVVEFRDITQAKKAEEDTRELEKQLRQAQKLEAVGRLAGGVAHDFNNLLGVIIGYSEIAIEDTSPTSHLNQVFQEIREAALRSADLTRQLLAFARKQSVSPKAINLNDTIEGMIKMLKRLIGENITLKWKPENSWIILIDPGQIDQILANLCVNARDAIANIGEIIISTNTVSIDSPRQVSTEKMQIGDYSLLSVSDNGSGMPPEIIEKIFEPFFTTKEQGKGTGLGLATVYGIVKQNNGYIDVVSRQSGGTTFEIYFPRLYDESHHSKISESSAKTSSGTETVLVVEDDEAILKITTTMLDRLGYTTIASNSPKKAIDIATNFIGTIDLLLTDVIMPEMNGRDLAESITAIHPAVKCLFMSGYTADIIESHGVLNKGVRCLRKPFSRQALGSAIRAFFEANDNITSE